MGVLSNLTVVMASWMYAFVISYQIVYHKYVQFMYIYMYNYMSIKPLSLKILVNIFGIPCSLQ